jgi:hypothetical protein
MTAWLPLHPRDGAHVSRQSPIQLLWDEEKANRRAHCGALALLRDAAAGSGPALAWILKQLVGGAAAALVEQLQDDDALYECGAGLVPMEAPSPRRLLLAAFGDRPRELSWISELADGAEDWDSGPGALPVPRGEALRPGEAPMPPDWINKL